MWGLPRSLSPLLMIATLAIASGCQAPDESRVPSPSPDTAEVLVPVAQPAPPPKTGAASLRAAVVWRTDGKTHLTCRFWVDFRWDPTRGAYVSTHRLPLSHERPAKMELLLDARPWSIGNDVQVTLEPLRSGTADSLGEARLFAHGGRDYVSGPQVGAVLRRGDTDRMDASRPEQDLRIQVLDPERDERLFTAILELSEDPAAPGC